MKKTAVLSALYLAVLACGLFGQKPVLHGRLTTLPVKLGPVHTGIGANAPAAPAVTPIPSFSYSILAYDGNTYTGTILGRSPYSRGKTTTTIPTQIVPLVITINDGTTTQVYDPTAPDPCLPNSQTDVSLITGSPIFNNTSWTMNGVNMGNTQYIDAFQRAEFWSLVGGTPYHLMLNESTLPKQTMNFSGGATLGSGTNYDTNALFGGCGFLGVVDITAMDNAIMNMITGPLAGMVNIGTFPIFLTKNVVMGVPGTDLYSNCCVLGYHSAFTVGSNLQIYSPFSLDTTGLFGGDVATLSHEMGEAINDPTTNNVTPSWGNLGQVLGTCQNNFEVGDPLSEGYGTPSTPFAVNMNGLTYHMQELAFYGWYFGANLGAGGKYSNNGSFGGYALPCPPGGTN